MSRIRWIVVALVLLALFPLALDAQTSLDRTKSIDSGQVGYLSTNPHLSGSTSSPMLRFDLSSPNNPYGQYGVRPVR